MVAQCQARSSPTQVAWDLVKLQVRCIGLAIDALDSGDMLDQRHGMTVTTRGRSPGLRLVDAGYAVQQTSNGFHDRDLRHDDQVARRRHWD